MADFGNILTKICDYLESLFDKKETQVIQALICGVVPLVFFTFFSMTDFHNEAVKKLNFLKYLDSYVIPIVIICLILNALPTILLPLINLVSTKSKSFGGLNGMMALLNSLESVVKAKYKRFELVHKNNLNNPNKTPESIFSEITKPEQQLVILVETLHLFAKEVVKQRIKNIQDGQIKVRLIKVTNNMLNDYFHCAPQGYEPHTTIEQLKAQDSTVMNCLQKKRMILIPDIETEISKINRRYVCTHINAGDDFDTDKGSLICYPILFDHNVEYILCVSTCIPFFFRDHLKDVYKFVLDQFSLRMQLEITLFKLKEII